MDFHRVYYDFPGFHYHHETESNPTPLDFARHCHNHYELIYVTGGRGRYIVEGAQYGMSPGTLLLLRPREFHYVELEPGTPYERYVLHFDENTLVGSAEVILTPFLDKPLGEGNFYTETEVPAGVCDIFERMDDLQALHPEQRELMLRLMTTELLILLSTAAPAPKLPDCEQLGARVIKYLNENISRPIGLDELARRFFVSKYYLCRAFKEHNGVSVHGYITGKRVMLAKLLMDRGETASVAAYRVGFGDYSSFYRAYKKYVGRSPSAK